MPVGTASSGMEFSTRKRFGASLGLQHKHQEIDGKVRTNGWETLAKKQGCPYRQARVRDNLKSGGARGESWVLA